MAQIKTKFITDNAITNAKAAQMAAHTYKGNNTGSTANSLDVTSTQLTADLDLFSSTLQGLVPASGGGTTAFLRADGTFAVPPGTASGTVTSVALTMPSIFGVSGSPVTTSGTLAVTLNTENANIVFAGPVSGGAATPAFRALVAADIPLISLTSGVSGILPIANGGTGQATANAAFNALSPMTTAGDIIFENATPVAARLGIGSSGQVLTVVAGLPAWVSPSSAPTASSENITLSGTDITNQYVDLAHPITGASASVNSAQLAVVGGPIQLKTVDYTVSLTGGSGGVTRITFAGDLATGGAAALIATDILIISYSF